jgi:uncharacterized protein (TIGR02996 family)
MSEEQALLAAIRDRPDDDALRLVYADWLEEHCDADRAELVRVQVELARLPWVDEEYFVDERRERLRRRERALLERHQERWLAGLPRCWGVKWQFHRGLPGSVVFDSATGFRDHAAKVFTAAPVHRLEVKRLLGVIGRRPLLVDHLVNSELLARLTELNLGGLGIGDAGVVALARSPHTTNLTVLELGGNGMTGVGLRELTRSPILAKLRFLDLGVRGVSTRLDDDAVEEFCNAGQIGNLKVLLLKGAVGARGVLALAGAPALAGLEALELDHCPVGEQGAAALARSRHLTSLGGLYLWGTGIGDAGLGALAGSRGLAGLESLRLWGNDITDAGVRKLTRSRAIGRLVNLDLCGNEIADAGAKALAGWPGAAGLRVISLATNHVGDAGALALADSPYLGELRRMNLYNNPISETARAALKPRFGDRVWW